MQHSNDQDNGQTLPAKKIWGEGPDLLLLSYNMVAAATKHHPAAHEASVKNHLFYTAPNGVKFGRKHTPGGGNVGTYATTSIIS